MRFDFDSEEIMYCWERDIKKLPYHLSTVAWYYKVPWLILTALQICTALVVIVCAYTGYAFVYVSCWLHRIVKKITGGKRGRYSVW